MLSEYQVNQGRQFAGLFCENPVYRQGVAYSFADYCSPSWTAMLPPQVKPEPAVQEKQWSPTGIGVSGDGSVVRCDM